MLDAYWHFISPFDWIILSFGTALLLVQCFALYMRYFSDRTLFVQHLDRIQSACLQGAELLPVLGLVGTVMAMLNTFSDFAISPESGVDVIGVIHRFAPALTTTLSGLIMVVLNLPLNLVLYLLIPRSEIERG